MKISVAERHIRVNEALRAYAISKVEHLKRYFDGIISVDVVLDVEKGRQICELVARLVKKVFKASAEAPDMHAAIDEAVDRLKGQLTRYKGRLRDRRAQGTRPLTSTANIAEEASAGTDHPQREIIHTQVPLKKPMTLEEAILQLESEGKDLLIFIDAERETLSIIHRLGDGRYELLEPEY